MNHPLLTVGARLCSLDGLADPGVREVVLGEGPGALSIIVLRQGERVTAYRNRCPHFQIPLNPRPDAFLLAGEGQIMCAFHSAVFRFSDGLCVDGPCKGAGLEPIPVTRDGDAVLAA